MTPEDLKALDPGIRLTVEWLNDNRFYTTDSGDGVSKPDVGKEEGCSLDFPHVAIVVEPHHLIQEADRLHTLLFSVGYWPPKDPNVKIEATYDPNDRSAVLFLSGIDDVWLLQKVPLSTFRDPRRR